MGAPKNKKSLRERAFRASAWTVGGHMASQGLRLGGNLVMTRLLVPEMFGIMALANIFYIGLALFSDLGLRANIIQSRRGDDPVFLNTVWTVQIIRGLIIWLLAIGLAVAIEVMNNAQFWEPHSVYATSVLPYVIGIIAFNAVISGFNSTNLATANRSMMLGLITRVELLSQLAGLVFMICWAVIDRSIWALVAGSLFSNTTKMVCSHVIVPGIRNKISWDSKSFYEVLHFGKWIFLASILGFLAANGDRLVLADLVDSTVLGLYAIAMLMTNSMRGIFWKLIGKVALPAFSEIVRDRPDDLLRAYYKIRLPIDAVSLLGAGFLFMTGHYLIEILYDDRYLQAGRMLEILSLSLFMERFSLTGNCFMALGKPKLLVPLIVVKVAMIFLFVPIAYSTFGLEAALWVIAGSALPALPIFFYFKSRYKLLSWKREFYALFFLGGGIGAGFCVDRVMKWLALAS